MGSSDSKIPIVRLNISLKDCFVSQCCLGGATEEDDVDTTVNYINTSEVVGEVENG